MNELLIGEIEAQVWASEWRKAISENPNIPTDDSTMVGWFANAIMTGHDHGRLIERQRNIVEKLREIIYQAAGTATGEILMDHPDYVFPSDRISEVVNKVCLEFGIPKVEGY